jgi:peptidylprolyl isomerase
MNDRQIFTYGLLICALAVGGGWWLYGRSMSAMSTADDGPGPNMVIEVEGQAKGQVVIDLDVEAAPNHVRRITELARSGAYDGVVFHRVIEGFMAQTGDVEHGRRGGDLSLAGTGGSDLPDLAAEFSDRSFLRGTVGMARSQSRDSANSQFFIMFAAADHLNGEYTVVGHVISGMEVVDAIRKGSPDLNGAIEGEPDVMAKVTVE